MKRALKILIPLTLLAALIVAGAWFFLSYRSDLTCSFFLRQAERCEAQGRAKSAIRWYGRAWSLCPEDAQIAMDLADAYAQSGNYTKAEYTLVRAITNAPDNLPLYLALSRTYVAQDKLLDAEQMLSRTVNEQVKLELDKLRPAPPKLSPEGGSYNEYIEVSLSHAGGTALLSSDGDFPSLQKDAYTGPITLNEGETTLIALTVSEDGLVSTPLRATYTVGGVIEEAVFVDKAVEDAVRALLDKSPDEPVMTDELWGLATLELPPETKTLSDLLPCRALASLKLCDASGVDFSGLANLTGLESLELSGCTISSGALSAIASLPGLTELRLRGCALTNISALSALTGLRVLDLSENAIQDIEPLRAMPELREVYLGTNGISTIEPLSGAAELELLDISANRVATIAPLADRKKLAALQASDNKLTDVAPLASCTALKSADISNNQVADIAPLAGLEELGTLLADQNRITAMPDFSRAVSLNRISLNYNQVDSVEGLRALPYLNYVAVDYNRVSDLSPLVECPTLVQVDAFANPVADTVGGLLEMDVIVNYDPTYTAPEEDEEESEE